MHAHMSSGWYISGCQHPTQPDRALRTELAEAGNVPLVCGLSPNPVTPEEPGRVGSIPELPAQRGYWQPHYTPGSDFMGHPMERGSIDGMAHESGRGMSAWGIQELPKRRENKRNSLFLGLWNYWPDPSVGHSEW